MDEVKELFKFDIEPTNGKYKEPNIIFLGFADNRVPEFKEVNSKEYILFGKDNLFPDQLLYLYNKSSNHNAIVNGKVTYIIGKGLALDNPVLKSVNRNGENFNKILKKCCTDIELFGGFYLQIVWLQNGKPEIFHQPFETIRKAKDQPGYWHCKKWNWKENKKVDPTYIPPFDINNRQGAQIFSYKEYRPGCDTYPLPGYFGALNDIETDVEISIYNLSVIKNGQFSGKLISFFNGIPEEEAKKVLEKKWTDKFNGSGNAGKTMLAFNNGTDKEPAVTDLSTTDLDKLFDLLNKTVQAEIFSGHQVTSPMLFGIMEPGKLGGRNELQDAYEIFKNTYINDKQMALEEVVDFILPLLGVQEKLKFIPVEPLSVLLNPVDFKESLPKEWVFEKLGIDITKYPSAAIPQAPGIIPNTEMVNDNVKNLTGRQHQQLLRIIRQYSKGQITKEVATTLLKTGLGVQDSDISSLLGIDESFSAVELEEQVVAEMFADIGEKREYFTVVKSQKFSEPEEMLFADIKGSDSAIIDLIRKDKRITPKIIGQTIKESEAYVKSRIEALTKSGVITPTKTTIGIDTIIEHAVNPEQIDTQTRPETVNVYIKYSYEPRPGLEPIIETTRPFCKRLIELDRLYTRAEIESISQRVGYSVFDRKGGFWYHNGEADPECRHRWMRNVVIKKNKQLA